MYVLVAGMQTGQIYLEGNLVLSCEITYVFKSLIVRKIQIKTTVKDHFIPIMMATFKK